MWRRHTATLALVLAVALTAGADLETVVHVFQLRHASVTEASAAIQPMLSDRGSITVQPRQARITVQDLPDVVQRVADLIDEIDRMPMSYRIQVDLLEGTSRPLPVEQQIRVDERLAGMFKFPAFRRLGSAVFECDLGSPSSAELGNGFKISFLAETTGFSQDSPWGTPDPGNRIHLRWLQLDRLRPTEDGRRTSDEILRTSIFIAPKQKVFIGAGKSEDSTDGLVLIVEAQDVGGG